MPGVTRCRNAETGGEAELPTDALKAWQAHGWEPVSGESRSLEEAEAQRVDAENAAALADAPQVPAETVAAATPPSSPGSPPVTRPTGTTAGDAGTIQEGEN